MRAIINGDGEFRIEDNEGDVVYGPVGSYSWPISKDAEALEAVLLSSGKDQSEIEMWKVLFGAVDIEDQ